MSVHLNTDDTRSANGGLAFGSSPGDVFTFCGFFRFSVASDRVQTLFATRNNAGGSTTTLRMEMDIGGSSLRVRLGSTTVLGALTSPTVAGPFYFFGLSRAGTASGDVKTYFGLPGSLTESSSTTGAADQSPDISTIGKWDGSTSESLVGQMHGVRIWNSVLSLAEMQAESLQSWPRRWASLWEFWPFHNVSGNWATGLVRATSLTTGSKSPAAYSGNAAVPYKPRRRRTQDAAVTSNTVDFAVAIAASTSATIAPAVRKNFTVAVASQSTVTIAPTVGTNAIEFAVAMAASANAAISPTVRLNFAPAVASTANAAIAPTVRKNFSPVVAAASTATVALTQAHDFRPRVDARTTVTIVPEGSVPPTNPHRGPGVPRPPWWRYHNRRW